MIKQLSIKCIQEFNPAEDFSLLETHRIDTDNWNYPADVEACFGIAFNSENLFIRYLVRESNIKAVYRRCNDPVHEDSCVEFFISFEPGKYYNLEFNCIGTIHGQYGTDRESRADLGDELLGSILVQPSLGPNRIIIEDRPTEWSLDVVIPVSVFGYSQLTTFHGKSAYGNFYKCGDKQARPHYLSWNPVNSEKPDFHRPEYFGEIKFA